MFKVNFTMISIIHKMLVLLKITRILKDFLKSIIDFYFFKINFFTTCNDGKSKSCGRKHNQRCKKSI